MPARAEGSPSRPRLAWRQVLGGRGRESGAEAEAGRRSRRRPKPSGQGQRQAAGRGGGRTHGDGSLRDRSGRLQPKSFSIEHARFSRVRPAPRRIFVTNVTSSHQDSMHTLLVCIRAAWLRVHAAGPSTSLSPHLDSDRLRMGPSGCPPSRPPSPSASALNTLITSPQRATSAMAGSSITLPSAAPAAAISARPRNTGAGLSLAKRRTAKLLRHSPSSKLAVSALAASIAGVRRAAWAELARAGPPLRCTMCVKVEKVRRGTPGLQSRSQTPWRSQGGGGQGEAPSPSRSAFQAAVARRMPSGRGRVSDLSLPGRCS